MREIFSLIRWKQFITGIIFFASSFIVCILSVVFYLHSSNEWDSARKNMIQQQSINNDAQRQLQKYQANAADFQRLKDRGFVGNKKRLQWLETLADVGEEYDIPGVNFTLADTKPAEPLKDHYYHDDLTLEVTYMSVLLDLVHEGDWFNFMKFLGNNAQGMFSAEQCRLDRESSGLEAIYRERIKGSCELKWFTIVDFSETWEQL